MGWTSPPSSISSSAIEAGAGVGRETGSYPRSSHFITLQALLRFRISYLPVGNKTCRGQNAMYGMRRIGLETIGMTHILEGQIDEAAPTAGPPDWDAITEEIACPLCEYNLRGLTEPRCPECGYRFGWREMLDPTLRLHPYLFEHHPERSVWALSKTFAGHLRPIRFWRQLHPNQPSNPRRILRFWLYIAFAFLFTIGSVLACAVWITQAENTQIRASVSAMQQNPQAGARSWLDDMINECGSVQAYLDKNFPTSWWRICRSVSVVFLVYFGGIMTMLFLWPWLTLATFMIFRQTFGRVRIRPSHLMRIVVYSCDAIVWPCFGVVAVAAVAPFSRSWGLRFDTEKMFTILGVVFGLAAIMWLFRLVVALKLYLQFDRPMTVVLCSQMILVLIAVNIILAPVLWQ